jgi:hypothetical protein
VQVPFFAFSIGGARGRTTGGTKFDISISLKEFLPKSRMRVSGVRERRNIRFSAADHREREAAVMANRNSPQKHVWRAKTLGFLAGDLKVWL